MEPIFTNEQIQVEELPHVEEVLWVPLQKKYLPISLLSTWIFGFVLCGIFLAFNFFRKNIFDEYWIVWAVVGGILFLFVLISILSILGFRHKAYAIREHDILFKTGLIFRRTTALPFNRVQHSEINQGPIERNFDLAQLEIFTAGGSQSDLTIPGLLNEEAQRIKAFIMEKTRTNHEE